MQRRIAGLITLTILGLVMGLTSPAHADTHKFTDAPGDVIAFADGPEAVAAPDNTDADALKTTVRHGRSRLVVKVKLRDLHAPDRFTAFSLIAFVRTNNGMRFVDLTRYGDQKFLEISRETRNVRCPGATRQISAADNLVKFSIPRSCLGRPKWIKVGLHTLISDEDALIFDDPLRTKPAELGLPKFTPKLKRG